MKAAKRIIVIGGGATGCATAHDLALRGFEVVVVERGDIASATTGRCSCWMRRRTCRWSCVPGPS